MPTLRYVGSAATDHTSSAAASGASCRIQTLDKTSGNRNHRGWWITKSNSQLVVDVPTNKSNQKERHYTITVSVPPAYEEDDDEGDEVQDLLHISKIQKIDDLHQNLGTTIGNCIICWDKPCNCSFCPCGHVATCYNCAVMLYVTSDGCPVCRQYVTNIQKIYLSCQKSGVVDGSLH